MRCFTHYYCLKVGVDKWFEAKCFSRVFWYLQRENMREMVPLSCHAWVSSIAISSIILKVTGGLHFQILQRSLMVLLIFPTHKIIKLNITTCASPIRIAAKKERKHHCVSINLPSASTESNSSSSDYPGHLIFVLHWGLLQKHFLRKDKMFSPRKILYTGHGFGWVLRELEVWLDAPRVIFIASTLLEIIVN